MASLQFLRHKAAWAFAAGALAAFLFTLPASITEAHEVYVLSKSEIAHALAAPAISPLLVIEEHLGEFIFWAFLAILAVTVVFFISILRATENFFDPWLIRLKHYAPMISRITLGISFIAAAHYQAIFGPELPLNAVFPGFESLVTFILYTVGVLIVAGAYVRLAAFAALGLFMVALGQYGSYMLTYTNYLGEIAVLLLVGAHRVSVEHSIDTARPRFWALFTDHLYAWWSKYSFLILRVSFGISLIYASFYAKFLHSNLAYTVAIKYDLMQYFPFDPSFLVLGAAIVEMLLGIFFILGIEIRFTAIFLNVFLILSLLYFGEVVWPHIILFGIPAAFFMYGYDKYSIEGYFFKEGDREPVF